MDDLEMRDQQERRERKELLELAAKAAGYIPTPNGMEVGEGGPMSKGGLVFSGNGECVDWNPLDDDGDALRLAVKLGMIIAPMQAAKHEGREAFTAVYSFEHPARRDVLHDGDPLHATRRAIVGAAAEIGKAMQ